MAKAILVMDMPDKCFHCPMSDQMDAALERWYCQMKSKEIEDMDSRPDWCPLLPFPPKQDSSNLYNGDPVHDSYIKGLDDGYNALREILERNDG